MVLGQYGHQCLYNVSSQHGELEFFFPSAPPASPSDIHVAQDGP